MKTTPGAIHVHVHHDMEQYASSFNQGYETAMAQHLAPDVGTATDWLEEQKAKACSEALSRVLALADAYHHDESRDGVISPHQIRQAVADSTGPRAIQYGVQWDSNSTGPWGERPWHPVEWCDDEETAKAVAATAQRPWTNPRVVKRVAPGEWQPQECADASGQEPNSPTPQQAIAQVIYEACYVRLPVAYEDRDEPDGYAEDWAECMEGASQYLDTLAALADKQSTDAPWQNERLIAKLVGAWLRGSSPR